MTPKKDPKSIDYLIDATNVCSWHAANVYDKTNKKNTHESFSLQPLLQLLILINKKGKTFQCIFDANTIFNLPAEEKDTYTTLLAEYKDFFYQVIGGIRADDFVLSLANRYNSSVISNDNFADYVKTYPWLARDAKPLRLFKGGTPMVAGDRTLVVPDLKINLDLTKNTSALYGELTTKLISKGVRHFGEIVSYDSKSGKGKIKKGKNLIDFRGVDLTITKGVNVEFSIEEKRKKINATDIRLSNTSVDDEISRLKKENKLLINNQTKDKFTGIVEWYDIKKKYGAIKETENSDTIFFFSTGIEQKGLKLEKEMEVIFEKKINKKGPYAANIRLANPKAVGQDQSKEIESLKKALEKANNKIESLETKLSKASKASSKAKVVRKVSSPAAQKVQSRNSGGKSKKGSSNQKSNTRSKSRAQVQDKPIIKQGRPAPKNKGSKKQSKRENGQMSKRKKAESKNSKRKSSKKSR